MSSIGPHEPNANDVVAPDDRRQHVRVAGPFDARRIGAFPIPVLIYDLSEGGCFVNSLNEQRPGVAIVLEIDLPAEASITLKALTLYARPEFGFAVRFVEMTEELSLRLESALRRMAD